MKSLLIVALLTCSFFTFADEIPFPNNVTTMRNPTVNGYPFLAVHAKMHFWAEVSGYGVDQQLVAIKICNMLGYKTAFTYTTSYLLGSIDTEYTVLVVSDDLIVNPVSTWGFKGDNGKEYFSSVFQSLSCVKK